MLVLYPFVGVHKDVSCTFCCACICSLLKNRLFYQLINVKTSLQIFLSKIHWIILLNLYELCLINWYHIVSVYYFQISWYSNINCIWILQNLKLFFLYQTLKMEFGLYYYWLLASLLIIILYYDTKCEQPKTIFWVLVQFLYVKRWKTRKRWQIII